MRSIILLFAVILFLVVASDAPVRAEGGDNISVAKDEPGGDGVWLGVKLQSRMTVKKQSGKKTIEESTKGARVTEVVDDSPAEKAGIEDGDLIVRIDEMAIASAPDVTKYLKEKKPGDKVNVTVQRGGKEQTLAVLLEERPESQMAMTIPKIMKKYSIGDDFSWFEGNGKPVLGIKIQTLTKQLGEYFNAPNGKGVLVTEVMDIENSPAKQAGMKAGDVIVKINSESVEDEHDIKSALEGMKKGDKVTIEVVRNNARTALNAVLNDDVRDNGKADAFFKRFNPSGGGLMSHSGSPRIRIMAPGMMDDEECMDMDLDWDAILDEVGEHGIEIEKLMDQLNDERGEMNSEREQMEQEKNEMDREKDAVKKKHVKIIKLKKDDVKDI